MEAKLSEVAEIDLSEDSEQILTFEYPLYRRFPFVLFFCLSTGLVLLIILPISLLTLIRAISGEIIFERIGGPEGIGEFLVFTFVPMIMVFWGYTLNLFFRPFM